MKQCSETARNSTPNFQSFDLQKEFNTDITQLQDCHLVNFSIKSQKFGCPTGCLAGVAPTALEETKREQRLRSVLLHANALFLRY